MRPDWIQLDQIGSDPIRSGRIGSDRIGSHLSTSHRITLHHVALFRIGLHCVAPHWIASHRMASHRIGSEQIRSERIRSHPTPTATSHCASFRVFLTPPWAWLGLDELGFKRCLASIGSTQLESAWLGLAYSARLGLALGGLAWFFLARFKLVWID